jgi:hypothetical protein
MGFPAVVTESSGTSTVRLQGLYSAFVRRTEASDFSLRFS